MLCFFPPDEGNARLFTVAAALIRADGGISSRIHGNDKTTKHLFYGAVVTRLPHSASRTTRLNEGEELQWK